jgi:hypothetical protein
MIAKRARLIEMPGGQENPKRPQRHFSFNVVPLESGIRE